MVSTGMVRLNKMKEPCWADWLTDTACLFLSRRINELRQDKREETAKDTPWPRKGVVSVVWGALR